MGLLFDTPGLSIPSLPIASTSTSSSQPAKKRKRNDSGPDSTEVSASSSSGAGGKSGIEMNLGKLMKKMKEMEKDSGWGGVIGAGGKSGVEQSEKDSKKSKKEKKPVSTAGGIMGGKKDGNNNSSTPIKKDAAGVGNGKAGGKSGSAASLLVKPKPNRFEPAKKEKKSKKEKYSPASSSNSITSNVTPYIPEPEVLKAPTRHTAPNSEEIEADSTSAPQTNMQLALRAKLAGGKFRLLNETLYTSTGEEAWSTMKEEGAFDDVCTSFLSTSRIWSTKISRPFLCLELIYSPIYFIVSRWIQISSSTLAYSSSLNLDRLTIEITSFNFSSRFRMWRCCIS